MSTNAKTSNAASSASSRPVPPLKAIRLKCLDCSGDSAEEARKCVIPDCPLFPFRFGKNPFRTPMSEEKRKERGERLNRARLAKQEQASLLDQR